MTKEQLDAIRERCEAASMGPWIAEEPWKRPGVYTVKQKDIYIDWICYMQISNQPNYTNDANFIAHAREDIPALLDEIDRLNRELDAAVEVISCGTCRYNDDKNDEYCHGCHGDKWEWRGIRKDVQ